jgi:hypothetical protein
MSIVNSHILLPGTASHYLSVPDAAPLDITGDLRLEADIAAADWTPATPMVLVSKGVLGGQFSYAITLNTAGTLISSWSVDGTTVVDIVSTAAVSATDGLRLAVAASLDVDNGSGGYDVKFWTSPDRITWTQLGATVTGGAPTSIHAGTAPVEVGTFSGGNVNPFAGKVYGATIRSGILPTSTAVLNIDATKFTATGATSFGATTGQTVTINGTGTRIVLVRSGPRTLELTV